MFNSSIGRCLGLVGSRQGIMYTIQCEISSLAKFYGVLAPGAPPERRGFAQLDVKVTPQR